MIYLLTSQNARLAETWGFGADGEGAGVGLALKIEASFDASFEIKHKAL